MSERMNEKKLVDQEVTGPELLESTKRLILFVNESIVNCRPVSPRIYDYARSLAVCISPLLVKDLYLELEDQEREIVAYCRRIRDRQWHNLDELYAGYCKEHPGEKIGIMRFLSVVRNTRLVNVIWRKGDRQIIFLDMHE